MSTAEDEDDSRVEIAENIRTSLRYYPAKKGNIFIYLLEAYAITLEVFLHKEFGERYLSWFKSLVGFAFLYFVAIASPPYHFSDDYTFPLRLFKFIPIDVPIPLFEAKRVAGWNVIPAFLIIYYSAAGWRLTEIFLHNRFDSPSHPKSSGEPYKVWNSAYLLFHKWNFRVDLVKQVCEPLCCLFVGFFFFLAAIVAAGSDSLELLFIVFWLSSGSLVLAVKAHFENRRRKSLFLDRLSSDNDLAALRMQQRLSQPSSTAVTFSEVT